MTGIDFGSFWKRIYNKTVTVISSEGKDTVIDYNLGVYYNINNNDTRIIRVMSRPDNEINPNEKNYMCVDVNTNSPFTLSKNQILQNFVKFIPPSPGNIKGGKKKRKTKKSKTKKRKTKKRKTM